MPTNYTPVPGNAPATNTLPSDLDDADAESVNVAFRAAADNLMGLAALKAASNVFTAGPQEVNVNDSSTAALVTRTTADDDANGGNKWKAVLGFALGGGGGSYINVYAGKIGGPQQLAIVLNAVWDTTNQRWFKDNTGADSIALLMSLSGSVQVSRRPAGAGTWTTWAADQGVLNADSVNLNSAFVNGVISAASGFVTPGSTGDFSYAPVKLRQPMPAPISGGNTGFVTGLGECIAGTTSTRHFPLRIPENCGGVTIEVMFRQATSAVGTFSIGEYTADWTTPGALTENIVDSATTPAVSAYDKLSLSLASVTPGAEYRLVWAPGNVADTMVALRGTTLLDYGPRNTL